MNKLMTITAIEAEMAVVIDNPDYSKLQAEYHRLLSIMGNVDGDESIALVMVAWCVVSMKDKS